MLQILVKNISTNIEKYLQNTESEICIFTGELPRPGNFPQKKYLFGTVEIFFFFEKKKIK